MWKLRIVTLVALIVSSGVVRAGFVSNLAADWSDTSNPNGVWTYEQAPGNALTTHQNDDDITRIFWTTAQPAWANAQIGAGHGSIPVFYKAVSTFKNAQNDQPLGHVYMQNNDFANSPPAIAASPASIAWTAPSAGTITISGDLWEVQRYLGRSEDWSLVLNGQTITSGVVTPTNATSAAPLDFSTGSGAPGALVQTVFAGEVLRYEVQRDPNTTYATFTGIDFNVNLTPASSVAVPEPSTLVLGLTGSLTLAAGAWRRRKLTVRPTVQ